MSLVCNSEKSQCSIENNRQNYINGSSLLQTCIVEKFELIFKNEKLSACRQVSCAKLPVLCRKRNFEDLFYLVMSYLLFGGFLVRRFKISDLQV